MLNMLLVCLVLVDVLVWLKVDNIFKIIHIIFEEQSCKKMLRLKVSMSSIFIFIKLILKYFLIL